MKRILQFLDIMVRLALVSALVFGFAWALMQWAKHRPTIAADDSGALVLTAAAATTHGPPEIRFSTFKGEKNIGWWDFDTQSLSWKIDVEYADRYQVELRYSRPGSAATGLELRVGDATLVASAPGTGGWDKWQTIPLGTIALAAGDGQDVTLKAIGLPSKGVINFVRIKLTPDE
jgi:hypothetical protein